jgi:hypothetical protein
MARIKSQRRCPILIEFGGQLVPSNLFASDAEQAAAVAIRIREKGWKPYRVKFDDDTSTWIVSSLTHASQIAP